MSNTPFLNLAPHYWAQGLPAIPLRPRDKMPPLNGWQQFAKRMPTEAEQAAWLASYASGNIGLPLGPASGLAMVDIDVEDKAVIERLLACLPESPWVRVGKKGLALALRHNPIVKSFKVPGPDRKPWVEYLSTGNQCVQPYSTHPDCPACGAKKVAGAGGFVTCCGVPNIVYTSNTNLWEVLDQIPATPDDIEARLRAVIGGKESKRATKGREGVAEGGRHGALVSEAGRLRNQGSEGEHLLAALRAFNEQHCNPPQDDEDVVRIALDAEDWDGGDGLPFTELGNAKRLVRLFEGRIRYNTAAKEWMLFDGVRWREDTDGHVMRLAKDVAVQLLETADENGGQRKWGKRSQSASAIKNMVELAKSEPKVSLVPDVFDADPYLLNTLTGVCDLRTATIRPAEPEDYLTKCTDVGFDPEAECPRWLRFLEEVFPDPELRAFMQPLAGYVASGLTAEHIGIFALGAGRNGKSVMFNTLARVLGSYSTNTSYTTFMSRPATGATPELAALKGARLVTANEGNRGQRLDSALFKGMTGGDPITARPLFAAPMTFRPQFSPVVISNFMPEMDGNDPALWARAVLIPFTRTFDGEAKDLSLPETLRKEEPGILRWIVEGAAQYIAKGLQKPAAVTAAGAAYRNEMDVIGAFIAERCTEAPTVECSAQLLYVEFERFARELGVRIPTRMEFGMELGRKGHTARKSGIVYRQGLTLKPELGWATAA